ncbi:hypothetical protein [Methylotuvimicrobium alcaliphilum]|uniref:hypothetical protein n=1 Tax=Methylotuvimicrobium alcaliphilum TaxID=271065 RepID=UPI003B595D08
MNEALRRSKVESWQQQFFSLENIDALTKFETEKLIKAINSPPVELKKAERQSLQLMENKLISHIDQMSMDDILNRIERLPVMIQRQLYDALSERLVFDN